MFVALSRRSGDSPVARDGTGGDRTRRKGGGGNKGGRGASRTKGEEWVLGEEGEGGGGKGELWLARDEVIEYVAEPCRVESI